MKTYFLRLRPSEEVGLRLRTLQETFSRAVELAWEIGRTQGCSSRVALHHLAYETIRNSELRLGAQLTCNAIYLASAYLKLARTGKRLTQSAGPGLRPDFAQLPVYLDKHTLAMKDGQLSIYTLDGRAKLSVKLPQALKSMFGSTPVKEILLIERKGGFILLFIFKPLDTEPIAQKSQIRLATAASDVLEHAA